MQITSTKWDLTEIGFTKNTLFDYIEYFHKIQNDKTLLLAQKTKKDNLEENELYIEKKDMSSFNENRYVYVYTKKGNDVYYALVHKSQLKLIAGKTPKPAPTGKSYDENISEFKRILGDFTSLAYNLYKKCFDKFKSKLSINERTGEILVESEGTGKYVNVSNNRMSVSDYQNISFSEGFNVDKLSVNPDTGEISYNGISTRKFITIQNKKLGVNAYQALKFGEDIDFNMINMMGDDTGEIHYNGMPTGRFVNIVARNKLIYISNRINIRW